MADWRSTWSDGADLVERVEWEEFYDYLSGEWHAGQHLSIFSETEGGKTHMIRYGLLPLWQRYPVLYFDLKPKAQTIAGMGKVVHQFPTWDQRLKYRIRDPSSAEWERDPQWFRLKPPQYHWSPDPRREDATWRRARRVVGEAIDRAFTEGGWVLVVDDTQTVTDPQPPSLDLAAPMRNAWRNGREQPLTVVAATQQPAGAPTQMYDQPTYFLLGGIGDVRRHERLGEIGGDVKLIEAVLPTLDDREFLFTRKRGRDMMIVTAPPARRRRAA